MSKAAIVSAALYVLVGVACATGGQNGGDEKTDASTSSHQDASNIVQPDAAPPKMDAGVTQQDAQVSQLPDAGGGGLFCTANNQCTNAGECCITLGGPQGFCGTGTIVFGECIPQ